MKAVQDQEVWIPCDYRAKDEEYRLLLPGARLHGYVAKDAGNVSALVNAYPLVAVQVPLGLAPQICESCKIIGRRMEMRARHSDEEIKDMLMGHIAEHLFVTEYLISTPVKISEPQSGKDACR